MQMISALLGDALLFGALIWFAGYGAMGPAIGLRLALSAKLRLFAEAVALSALALYLFIRIDQAMGWVDAPPWSGSPPPHRLVALGLLITLGFLYTRRRARALHVAREGASDSDAASP